MAKTKAEVDEERAKRKDAPRKDDQKKAELAKKWDVPWPPPDRKGTFGRLSHKAKQLKDTYALISDVVSGKKPEPEFPPHQNEMATSTPSTAKNHGEAKRGGNTVRAQKKAARGITGHVDDETIKRFFEIKMDMNIKSDKDAIAYVCKQYPARFGTDIAASTVTGWKKRYQNIMAAEKEKQEEKDRAMEMERKKPGPKTRDVPIGEFKPSRRNNQKLSVSMLMAIAAMIVAHLAAGLPLTSSLMEPIVIGYLETREPKITWQPRKSWYPRFLKKLGLSWRRATKAARSQPHDFETIRRDFILRVVWLVRRYNIPKNLFMNLDETGCCLLPIGKSTWGEKGAKQINVLGKDDKRQFTVVPVITVAGTYACPTQLIWAGTGKPQNKACHYDDKEGAFKNISQTHSESHWTTESTILELVASIYKHVERHALATGQEAAAVHWVLCWDTYPVHCKQDVVAKLKELYPCLHLLYIPGGCTGLLQALDLAFNYPFKRAVGAAFTLYLVHAMKKQLENNRTDEAVGKLDIRLSTLKGPFVRWVSTALKKMEGTKAMTGGWKDYVIAWPENDDDRNLCDQLYNEAKARFEAGTLYQSSIPKKNKQSKKTTDVELDSDPSEDEHDEDADVLMEMEMEAELARSDDEDERPAKKARCEEDSDDEFPSELEDYGKEITTRFGRTTKPVRRLGE